MVTETPAATGRVGRTEILLGVAVAATLVASVLMWFGDRADCNGVICFPARFTGAPLHGLRPLAPLVPLVFSAVAGSIGVVRLRGAWGRRPERAVVGFLSAGILFGTLATMLATVVTGNHFEPGGFYGSGFWVLLVGAGAALAAVFTCAAGAGPAPVPGPHGAPVLLYLADSTRAGHARVAGVLSLVAGFLVLASQFLPFQILTALDERLPLYLVDLADDGRFLPQASGLVVALGGVGSVLTGVALIAGMGARRRWIGWSAVFVTGGCAAAAWSIIGLGVEFLWEYSVIADLGPGCWTLLASAILSIPALLAAVLACRESTPDEAATHHYGRQPGATARSRSDVATAAGSFGLIIGAIILGIGTVGLVASVLWTVDSAPGENRTFGGILAGAFCLLAFFYGVAMVRTALRLLRGEPGAADSLAGRYILILIVFGGALIRAILDSESSTPTLIGGFGTVVALATAGILLCRTARPTSNQP
ncbi:hypothetical protein JK358_30885 [Nocardia sp. 2]|uniref:DUF998 domain-containing protein n=1 Tax=Nocardia acididurans TaxID=2802282 RepID=A0ABS1MGJ9_9NOCA|nr:hypothetical protein [Nocardia acididurans]MBL1078819.1 hypothetical protein [Nocardia acididurans]